MSNNVFMHLPNDLELQLIGQFGEKSNNPSNPIQSYYTS